MHNDLNSHPIKFLELLELRTMTRSRDPGTPGKTFVPSDGRNGEIVRVVDADRSAVHGNDDSIRFQPRG